MDKTTLRLIFSKHIYINRARCQLTQAQLANAVGTSLGWIQKIKSGRKLPGFFLAVKLVIVLEIDMNAILEELLEHSGPQVTTSGLKKTSAPIAAVNDPAETEMTRYV